MDVQLIQADARRMPLASNSVDMIFADPPYISDLLHTYEWLADEAARVLKPGRFVAAMCGGMGLNHVMRWFDAAGLTFTWLCQLGMAGKHTGIVWLNGDRKSPITTRTKHVLIYSKGPAVPRTAMLGLYWAGGGNDKRWHHWGQSVDSHRYYIDCLSWPGDLVVDPFVGGGTTLVACKALERRGVGLDIDPAALATSRRRQTAADGALPLFARGAS